MSYLPERKMVPCADPSAPQDMAKRTHDVDWIALKLLVPNLHIIDCWRCRARALADTIEACIRIAGELPPEFMKDFDADLALLAAFARKRTEAAKTIAADLITQARSAAP